MDAQKAFGEALPAARSNSMRGVLPFLILAGSQQESQIQLELLHIGGFGGASSKTLNLDPVAVRVRTYKPFQAARCPLHPAMEDAAVGAKFFPEDGLELFFETRT
jgi:hypothetical protein